MFERRAYRRKTGTNAVTVLLALTALGLLFLILRGGPDSTGKQGFEGQPGSSTMQFEQPGATDAGAAAPQQLSGLRREVERASQDLSALRTATEQMRAELSALRNQRASLLANGGSGQPGAVSASAPAPSRAGGSGPQAGEVTSAAAAIPASGASAGARQTRPPDAPPGSTAKTAAEASAPDGAGSGPTGSSGNKPAATQQQATQDRAPKPARRAHNAHGYLLTARDQIESGNIAKAEDALEQAETWALNYSGAYGDGADPADDPLVDTVKHLRTELRAGHSAVVLKVLNTMLPKQTTARTAAPNRDVVR